MILVLYGTQKHPFHTLTIMIETAISEGFFSDEEIIVQHGYSSCPKGFQVKGNAFYERKELERYMREARVCITHGGVGSIMELLHLEKKVIAVPRNASKNEHIDNHQFEIIQSLGEEGYLLNGVSFQEALKASDTFIPKKYISKRAYLEKELRLEVQRSRARK